MEKKLETFQVMQKRCDECLFTPQRIVSVEQMQNILENCDRNGQHFVCHKASLAGVDICCRGFYDREPYATLAMRLAAHLNVVEFVQEEELQKGEGIL